MELKDHFLIAMPGLNDDYFSRTVIYICDHNEQGSMGLVINQPTDLSLKELAAKLNFMMSDGKVYPEQVIMAGGPTNLERGFILHTQTEHQYNHSFVITDRLTLTTSEDIIESLSTLQAPEKFMLALGCASWKPHQLEKEIQNNDWLIMEANEAILFDIPWENRWTAAQQHLGFQPVALTSQAGYC